jgi:hypothetical protein
MMDGQTKIKQNDSLQFNQEYSKLELTYILRALQMFHDDEGDYYDYDDDDDDDDRKETNKVAEIPGVSLLT